MLRPTLKEFNDFIHLLDKLLSESINRDFFLGEVSAEEDHERKDGRIEVRQKGTIRMLDEWISQKFHTADRTPIDETIEILKTVRQLRQKPAHAIHEDTFDQKYIRRQRDIIKDVYRAVQTLRLMFANYPATRQYKNSALEDRIWTR